MAEKKHLAQRVFDRARSFWPISVILMTFTFLAQLDKVKQFSAYLSYALSIFRDLIHGLIEMPINLVIRLFGFNEINIPSPIPELMIFFSLLVFSKINDEKLERAALGSFLGKIHPVFILSNRLVEVWPEGGRSKKEIQWFILWVVEPIILWACFFVFVTVLFGHPVFILIVLFIVAFIDRLLETISDRWRHYRTIHDSFAMATNIFFRYLCPLIIFLSLLLYVFSTALEIIVPASEEFICKANERRGLPLCKAGVIS